jgi:hypothetical protein
MIECLRSTVGEMRQRWKWSGLDGQHPDAGVLASNGSFGFEHTTDQGDELPEKLTRGGCRGYTLRQLEQRGPLLRRQASMSPRWLRDWGNCLLKSRVGEIFPP